MKKTFLIATLSLSISLISLFVPLVAMAHQSGCHRWHSCPSDSGSYTCGDLGYPCRYGTYSTSSNYYYPTYTLPAPQNPANGNWNYETSSENWCNYKLTMTWDQPTSGDRFSIGVSKSAGADPGQLVDTSSNGYVFSNVAPGKWYINIKTGNSERWSGVSYWTVVLPEKEPALSINLTSEEGKDYLQYGISCLAKIEGPDELISYLKSNGNKPSGKVQINYQNVTEIKVKGWDQNNKEYFQAVKYTPPQVENLNASSQKSDISPLVGIALLSGFMWLIWRAYKWSKAGINN